MSSTSTEYTSKTIDSDSGLPPMTAKDLRALAGKGYAALPDFSAKPLHAQFYRDALMVRDTSKPSGEKAEELEKLYPTATSHGLLALLDIGAHPLQDQDTLSFKAERESRARWDAKTHSDIHAPAEQSLVELPLYHQFFSRVCLPQLEIDTTWLDKALKNSLHCDDEKPRNELIALGHLIPATIFLFDHILRTHSPTFLSPDQVQRFLEGLDAGTRRLAVLLDYEDNKQPTDLDRSHCDTQLGLLHMATENQRDSSDTIPTYFLLNAAFAIHSLCDIGHISKRHVARLRGAKDESLDEFAGKLEKQIDTWADLNMVPLSTMQNDLATALRRRLERCMANRNIPDDPDFDPVGLTFAMRGCCLIDRGFRQTPLFREAVRTIVDSQLEDGCWPDGTATSAQDGTATLQPSIEVAYTLAASVYTRAARTQPTAAEMAAMRIALPALQRQARYLELTFITSGGECKGWSSDRARHSSNPEMWITSLAIRFLHFAALIVESIDRSVVLKKYESTALLRQRKLTPRQLLDDDPEDCFKNGREGKDRVINPDEITNPVDEIAERFIRPIALKMVDQRYVVRPAANGVSFLLFGPPRSGKTYLVNKMAEALRWPLVSLDPGNFVQQSGESIGVMLARVFEDLMGLNDAVVFFDECDELMMSRSGDIGAASGLLPLITSSMLTRLADLHDRRGPIFCFATNYYHRIDRAVRGVGRFDSLILFDRPDAVARKEIICDLWSLFTTSHVQRSGTQQAPSSLSKERIGLLVEQTNGSSYIEIRAALARINKLIHKEGQSQAGGLAAIEGTAQEIQRIVAEESPSREDYVRWCARDGLLDLDAVEGRRFDKIPRNEIIERWCQTAAACGQDHLAQEMDTMWDDGRGRLNEEAKRSLLGQSDTKSNS